MGLLGTTRLPPLSTRLAGGALALSVLLGGCGWRLGRASAHGVPVITGASVEPGARLALARGASGHSVAVELLGVDVVPQASGPLGTAAWTSRVRARVGTVARPGCAGEVTAERVWVAVDPETAWSARSDAVAAAAEEVGRRAADAVTVVAACQP